MSEPVDMNRLGGIWGERAVQAPFMFIACKRDGGQFYKTMIGGAVIADMCQSDSWERWQGTMILIPKQIDTIKRGSGRHLSRLEQLMINAMPHDEPWRKQFGGKS